MRARPLTLSVGVLIALAAACGDDAAAPEAALTFQASNLRISPQIAHEGDQLVFSWDLVVSPRHYVAYVFAIDGLPESTGQFGMVECVTVEACRELARHEVRATSLIDRHGYGAHEATVYVHDDSTRVAGVLTASFRLE